MLNASVPELATRDQLPQQRHVIVEHLLLRHLLHLRGSYSLHQQQQSQKRLLAKRMMLNASVPELATRDQLPQQPHVIVEHLRPLHHPHQQ